ncbi:MAG: chemotaxis protein CheW, partial [Pseudomonadota bacterium]
FDDTGGVINGTGVSRVIFQPTDEGVKDVIVEGVLKLDGGARMVQLLDPFEILKIERLPRVAKNTGGQKEKSHLGQRLNCISFQLGHTTCAIDLRFVQEITDMPLVQKSQIAHGHILGNIELRGRTMPIVDFRGFMGNEEPFQFSQDALKNRKLVILSLDEGHIGLVVYSIDSIMAFFESDILPFANVALPRHDIVAGCLVNNADEIVILLDHEKLLRDETLRNAAQSCQEIYPSEQKFEEHAKLSAKSVIRATYILFTVDTPMAFDISHVSEIITRPDKLLQPPYALDFVDGILNLRGDLITLINPRVLYNLPEADPKDAKVLIFQKDDKKYGIIVDSVDEIVTTTSNELLDVPSISKNGVGRLVSNDVAGCLRVPSRGPESDPILVLDVGAVVARCVQAESF